jgi:hypothetical protein
MSNLILVNININFQQAKSVTINVDIMNKWVFFGMSCDFNTGKSTLFIDGFFYFIDFIPVINLPVFNNIYVGRYSSSSKVFPEEIRFLTFFNRVLYNDHLYLIYREQKENLIFQ